MRVILAQADFLFLEGLAHLISRHLGLRSEIYRGSEAELTERFVASSDDSLLILGDRGSVGWVVEADSQRLRSLRLVNRVSLEIISQSYELGFWAVLSSNSSLEVFNTTFTSLRQGNHPLRNLVTSPVFIGASQRLEFQLTRNEYLLVHFLGRGFENREIAIIQGKTVSSVRGQLMQLYRKLGVNNRTEAVRLAMERQLVSS